jgi:arginine exporter protein ArgO
MVDPSEPKWIFALQVASVAWIWIFVLGISGWIIHLIRLSSRLHDVPSASIGISIVAIPVFLTGASVLTYVFIGLQMGRNDRAGNSDHLENREGR